MKKIIFLSILALAFMFSTAAVVSNTLMVSDGDGGLCWDVNRDGTADFCISKNADLTVNGDAITVEGSTADDYETTVTFTDPTADNAVSFADAGGTLMLSSLSTNAPNVANSIWGVSGGLAVEGSSADDYETTIGFNNPTMDNTITMPDYTGAIPMVVAQGYTQTSVTNTTSDVTGSSLTLPDGWFTEGKALKFIVSGTSSGGNVVTGVDLYFEDASKMALDTASAGTGDWIAEFTIVATAADAQQIVGVLQAEAGAEVVADYATASIDTAAAGTIPVKVQLTGGHASDTITSEYVRVEHWVQTD